ncbi:nucleoporin complex subunit 54-domain-containing protein [Dichotomocladium elegans]|nr:nucleoporin complex subunit 54-domain-containing protein [Dichotomocladium elegans]
MFNSAQQSSQPQATGFTFGAATTTPATSTSAFTFGNPAPTSAPSFSFGTPAATSAPTSAPASAPAFSFGTPAATSAPSSGLFGNATGATGTSSAPATTTGNTFGFGNTQSSLNNAGTSTGGFGFRSNTAPSATGFGTGAFSLGSTLNQQNRDQQIYQLLLQADEEARRQQALVITSEQQYKPKNIWQSLALLRSWWDPNSPYCRFKYYFYNVVKPQEVHLYQKPPNHDKKAWDEAQKKNPDPSCLVPTLAVGLEDVRKRMDAQEQQASAHVATLKNIEAKINKMKGIDAQSTLKKLEDYKRRHMELSQRVIQVMKAAQILQHKGRPLTEDEEKMRAMLENIQDQLLRSEQFRGKLSQLWAQLQLIKESGRKYGNLDDVVGWSSIGEDKMCTISQALNEQQSGMEHTIGILERDSLEVDKLISRYKGEA